jgi:hypothetical protein
MTAVSAQGRPALRYLLVRLERLHDALASLGRRLRQAVASVVGDHVGDAVRDALQAALLRHAGAEPCPPTHRPLSDDPEETPDEPGHGDGLWPEHRPTTVPPVPRPKRPTCWWPVVPPALRRLGPWLWRQASRSPALTFLGVGAAAGIVALTVGPLAGVLVGVAGTVYAATALADGVTLAVGGLAGIPPD